MRAAFNPISCRAAEVIRRGIASASGNLKVDRVNSVATSVSYV